MKFGSWTYDGFMVGLFPLFFFAQRSFWWYVYRCRLGLLWSIMSECIKYRLRLIVHSCVRKLSWPYTHCVRKLSWPYTHCVRKLSWPYTASIIICSRKAVTAAVEAAAAISAEPLKGSAAMCSRKHCVYGQESGWPYTLCKIKHSR